MLILSQDGKILLPNTNFIFKIMNSKDFEPDNDEWYDDAIYPYKVCICVGTGSYEIIGNYETLDQAKIVIELIATQNDCVRLPNVKDIKNIIEKLKEGADG